MKCLKHSVTITILTMTLHVAFGDPSHLYENERVQSHVIDPNDNDTDFGPVLQSNDRVFSQVLNINDSSTSSVLRNFNLTRENVFRLNQTGRPYRLRENPHVEQENPDNGNVDHSFQIEQTKSMIKHVIESAVNRNTNSPSLPDPDAVIHQIAFYPVCSKNNENSWLAENTAKLYFSSSLFARLQPDSYLHRAELRLFQKNPDNTPESPQCTTDVDEIIRVTISVMVKGGNNRTSSNRRSNSRRETKYKKRFCKSFTTSKRKTGWVAVDIEQVIRQWEKAFRSNSSNSRAQISDPMLMIDVEDEDKIQLKAGTFFEPTDCKAAPAIPWSFYGEIRDSSGGIQVQAPHNPRIDLEYSRLMSTPLPYNYPLYQYYHHREHNRLENVRQLHELPLSASPSDSSSHHNFRYLSENQRTHRKRHIHHKHQSSRDEGFSNNK